MSGADELITWLRAIWDDDEQVIHEAAEDYFYADGHGRAVNRWFDRWSPDNPDGMLAEVEAKRRILDLYEDLKRRQAENSAEFVRLSKERVLDQQRFTNVKTHGWELTGRLDGLRAAIGLLAQPHAGRPGFRDEWRLRPVR
jgi:hypothetical protein